MREGYFDEQDICQFTKSILSGIIYCHKELKIVIGNLNPETVILDLKAGKFSIRIINLTHSFPLN
jgi:serine/threonine protein kinase